MRLSAVVLVLSVFGVVGGALMVSVGLAVMVFSALAGAWALTRDVDADAEKTLVRERVRL